MRNAEHMRQTYTHTPAYVDELNEYADDTLAN